MLHVRAPTMSEPHNQDQLAHQLEAIARGDPGGMRDLYQATRGRLFVVCLSIVKDREAAEDVLQEVYLKVWNRAAGYEAERGAAAPWLAMIARNAAIDWARARDRRASLDGAKYLITREDEAELPADEQLVQEEEGARAMREAAGLDVDAVRCLRAAFVDGLSYSEVATREGLPLGTVKSRIRRALQALRRSLDDG